MVPQSRWGGSPKPLGRFPKAVGEDSQSRWGGFPKPLGRVPKAVGEAINQRHDAGKSTTRDYEPYKQIEQKA